ncbi:hypothetical protein OIDMADRAFT_119171 [Oidiodendron maius Zn]|uniref:Transcription factor domain-containing protein n=1 Tax=Oidiodendron maius (strain Zn) TaxID=913774 RepID=A0A0C3H3R5_OIDMZ|nr:hypothetical protein OIDMADRAFT_119171 [Oidiodendron maius Zn]
MNIWTSNILESNCCANSEDALFMYYLDYVFYLQYPFYHCLNDEGRGWLFSTLKKFKPAYHASLALSKYSQYATRSRQGCHHSHSQLKESHYDLALQELQLALSETQTWSVSQTLVRSIECLTCIIQLLFWENWQIHLDGAAALVPALAQALTASITPASRYNNRQTFQNVEVAASGIRFLLGSFIFLDIISCASTRSSHFLELDHKLMLGLDSIQLENIMGCSNWVVTFIFEISLLDGWKRKAEKAQKLSAIELTKRGKQIDVGLRKRLADDDNRPSREHFSDGASPSTSIEITRIFALSAMTYLHVVISGAYPELPEIQESVSKTIHALQNLTDPKWLRRLVWPFCVSGCLALDGQKSMFRDLLPAAEITKSSIGTCPEAMKIIEECWEMRASLHNCDWVCVMNKWGHHILLS